jgi:hypothetical protein
MIRTCYHDLKMRASPHTHQCYRHLGTYKKAVRRLVLYITYKICAGRYNKSTKDRVELLEPETLGHADH